MANREQRESVIRKAAHIVRSSGSPFMMRAQGQVRLPLLHHVTVQVPPRLIGACLDFYCSVLRLSSLYSPIQKTAWFEQGIHLYWGDSDYCEPITPEPQHFAIVVGEHYNDIVNTCKKLGLYVSDATPYWGSLRCYVKDPAGNRIEIMVYAP